MYQLWGRGRGAEQCWSSGAYGKKQRYAFGGQRHAARGGARGLRARAGGRRAAAVPFPSARERPKAQGVLDWRTARRGVLSVSAVTRAIGSSDSRRGCRLSWVWLPRQCGCRCATAKDQAQRSQHGGFSWAAMVRRPPRFGHDRKEEGFGSHGESGVLAKPAALAGCGLAAGSATGGSFNGSSAVLRGGGASMLACPSTAVGARLAAVLAVTQRGNGGKA